MAAALFFICSTRATAQNIVYTAHAPSHNISVRTLRTKQNNFTSFTNTYRVPSEKWLANNKDYIDHPDARFLTNNDPSPNAVELFSKRTNNSRYYIDKDTAAKFYIIQSNGDINYQKNGQWLCIDKRLMPVSKNIIEASHQQEPVGFDLDKKASYIKSVSGIFYFNDWQLFGANGNTKTLIAKADWSHFSAGDDGLKITNIFPGVDAEMVVDRGSVETNFIIKQNNFPAYQRLVFTDGFSGSSTGEMQFTDAQNNEVDFVVDKKAIAHISKAVMYARKDPTQTYQYLSYQIAQNNLSLSIDTAALDHLLLDGDVVIDPLVSTTKIIPKASITGSMNNGNINNACKYPFVATTPAKATFTNVAVEFGMIATAPAVNKDAIFFVIANNCDTLRFSANPNQPSYDSSGYGVTVDNNGVAGFAAIPEFLNCLPPPACAPQNVGFVLGLYNTVTAGPDNVCSNQYVSAYEDFQLMIQGRTIEPLTIAATPQTICQGSSSVLRATAQYGVPPYISYNWSNGVNSNPVTVSPLVTTIYSVAIVDQCNDTAKNSITVTVTDPVTPAVTISTVTLTVCQNAATTFKATPTNGGNAPAYQWYLNGNPVGTNSNTYTNNALSNGDKISCVLTSNYFCLVTNIANSDTLTMTVQPDIVPTINITNSDNNFCFGKDVTFTAHTTNVGPSPSYQWYVDGNPVGTNDPSYANNTVENNDIVYCIVSVSNTGCYTVPTVKSNVVTMVIYPIPVISFSPDNIILARYDSVTINTSVVGDINNNFVWTPSDGLINPGSLTPTADPTVTTTYQLSVTSVNNCVDSADITIQVYDKIFIPSAFAPNGKNNIFRIPKGTIFNLDNFSVYDRWGNMVFTTNDINQGWDGIVGSYLAAMGVYVYVITGSDARGKILQKGTVTLIR